MAEKPSLLFPFKFPRGWFDGVSRLAVLDALSSLHDEVDRYVDIEVMDVELQAQAESGGAFSMSTFFGVVGVVPIIKGVTLHTTGFYRQTKKLEDLRFSSTPFVGNEKCFNEEGEGFEVFSVDKAVDKWKAEFKVFLEQYLVEEIRAHEGNLKKFQDYLEYIETGVMPMDPD